MPDVFISYSRTDEQFVRRLFERLQQAGKDVWVDFDDIPFASNWWEEILEGIQTSNTGIFVISPDSIQSRVCSLEISQLIDNHKRLVPIVLRPVDKDQRTQLPEQIREINWIFFDKEENFEASVANLLETLDQDLSFAKEHTRLLVRASEWARNAHSESLLLRGDELASFIDLIDRPELTDLQRQFLHASRNAEELSRRLRRFAFGFIGGMLGMGFYIFSVFRGEISPIQVALTIAAGEVFGLFVGLIALFSEEMPFRLKDMIPKPLHLPIRIMVCYLFGVFAWTMYHWFFLQLPFSVTLTATLGGLGLSAGFIVHMLLRPNILITFSMTAITTYIPLWLLSSVSPTLQNLKIDPPIIYFDQPDHVYTIAIPMALLLALGSNAELLWHQWRVYRRKKAAEANKIHAPV